MFKENRNCGGTAQDVFMPYSDMTQGEMPMEEPYPQVVLPGMEYAPLYEPPCCNVVQRQINHHVKHIQPIHTKIINNHIYHHSYVPCYSCEEENLCCDVYNPNPCCK